MLWAHIQGQREQISRQFPSASPSKVKQATLEQQQEQAEIDMDESLDRIEGRITVIQGRESATMPDQEVLQ